MEVGNESGIVVGKMSSYSKLLNVSVKMFNAFNYKVFAKGGNGNGSGGMVGTMNDGTTIENCLFDAPMQQQSGYFGGIVGTTNRTALISKCTVSGIFDQVSGYMGGIVGNIPYIPYYSKSSQSIKIQDCVVHANMANASNSSGIIGGIHCRKEQYYNSNTTGQSGVWGVTISRVIITGYARASTLSYWTWDHTYGETPSSGYFIGEWILDNSFYDRNKTSAGSYNTLEAKYTPEIRHSSTYGAYDFVNIWAFDEKNREGDPVLIKHIPPKLPILGFRNEIGLYYTDEAGNILRYLEYGTLVAGSTSEAYPVWVQNNADFPVKDMKVWVDPPTIKPGITVQLSLSNNPFVPIDEIPFPELYLLETLDSFILGSCPKLQLQRVVHLI